MCCMSCLHQPKRWVGASTHANPIAQWETAGMLSLCQPSSASVVKVGEKQKWSSYQVADNSAASGLVSHKLFRPALRLMHTIIMNDFLLFLLLSWFLLLGIRGSCKMSNFGWDKQKIMSITQWRKGTQVAIYWACPSPPTVLFTCHCGNLCCTWAVCPTYTVHAYLNTGAHASQKLVSAGHKL